MAGKVFIAGATMRAPWCGFNSKNRRVTEINQRPSRGARISVSAMTTKTLLSIGLQPSGLSVEQSAAYIGVSPNTFKSMVAAGLMPQPRCFRKRRIWPRRELDAALAALPTADGSPVATVPVMAEHEARSPLDDLLGT